MFSSSVNTHMGEWQSWEEEESFDHRAAQHLSGSYRQYLFCNKEHVEQARLHAYLPAHVYNLQHLCLRQIFQTTRHRFTSRQLSDKLFPWAMSPPTRPRWLSRVRKRASKTEAVQRALSDWCYTPVLEKIIHRSNGLTAETHSLPCNLHEIPAAWNKLPVFMAHLVIVVQNGLSYELRKKGEQYPMTQRIMVSDDTDRKGGPLTIRMHFKPECRLRRMSTGECSFHLTILSPFVLSLNQLAACLDFALHHSGSGKQLTCRIRDRLFTYKFLRTFFILTKDMLWGRRERYFCPDSYGRVQVPAPRNGEADLLAKLWHRQELVSWDGEAALARMREWERRFFSISQLPMSSTGDNWNYAQRCNTGGFFPNPYEIRFGYRIVDEWYRLEMLSHSYPDRAIPRNAEKSYQLDTEFLAEAVETAVTEHPFARRPLTVWSIHYIQSCPCNDPVGITNRLFYLRS